MKVSRFCIVVYLQLLFLFVDLFINSFGELFRTADVVLLVLYMWVNSALLDFFFYHRRCLRGYFRFEKMFSLLSRWSLLLLLNQLFIEIRILAVISKKSGGLLIIFLSSVVSFKTRFGCFNPGRLTHRNKPWRQLPKFIWFFVPT